MRTESPPRDSESAAPPRPRFAPKLGLSADQLRGLAILIENRKQPAR